MTFELEVAGRARVLTVEPIGAVDRAHGTFRITVTPAPGTGEPAAARVHEVEVRLTELGVTLVYAADRRVVDAAVTDRPFGEILVQLPRTEVSVVAGQQARQAHSAPGVPGAGEARLAAPMPGRILRVLARAGDEVAARQPIVVVEAMKMENEISAPHPGRVREVMVSEGESVAAGRTLAVIDVVR